jgi:hypothetical protein
MRESKVPSLRDEGMQLALEGKTSLDEVLRVTHDDEAEACSATPLPSDAKKARRDKEVA